MLPTLQWYIFRDMGKTFLLTAIGLTAVLGLGGGVMNLIELEQVSPTQFIRLMLIVLPVAGSLTLPVAALYSATATYGRMSADQEFVACRGSGINIQHLFLPPLTLSLLISFCTFYFSSFLVPGLVRDLNDLARTDFRQFVVQRLDSPKRLGLPGIPVRIYADRAAPARDDPSAVVLSGVAFLEVAAESYIRYGTAESIVIRFRRNRQGETEISGEFINAALFDVEQGAWGDAGNQSFGPEVLPRKIRSKVKWLDLGELIHFRRHPEQWSKVAEALDSTREIIAHQTLIASLWDDYAGDSELTLTDDHASVTLRAERGVVDPDGKGISFSNVTVTDSRNGETRTVTGAEATLSLLRLSGAGTDQATLRISGNVVVSRSQGPPERKGRERIAGVAVSSLLRDDVGRISAAALLDPTVDLDIGRTAMRWRAKAMRECHKLIRRVTSELHSRLAFSVSVFVLVILAAALGIVFRGAHVLAAFGTSFVPALFVIVMNIMGRQLAEKDGTVMLGLVVIWGAIVAVALLDAWLLTRVVRR